MDQPKIPTLKDAQKPQVKVKGLGSGLTLFDRLKQFKKKDLAFILAGLGTLFMAPLAEHFMMAPENGNSDLAAGFRGAPGSGNGIFGSGSSPYESGNNSIAQGGAIGGAGDIITPLNVRDPSALVMGPGAQQQPPAGAATPQVAAPTTTSSASSEDYKDALKASASRAASAAVKKSPLPIPKIAVGGSGLRGLGVAGGGSSASGGLGPIGGGSLGQAGTGGGGLNLVKSAPGYRGAAGARGPGNPTGLDGTKKAGANAGDAFSRTGSALSGLNAAAAEQIPTGGQGFGGGGQGGAGANDKGAGGNGPGGSKSVGESLAFIEAKERMMENLKLEFEKRKLKDPELLLYGIRNDSLKAMASEMTKSLTKGILGFMDPSSAANAKSIISCTGGYQGLLSGAPMCGEKADPGGCVQKVNGTSTYVWMLNGTKSGDCRVTGGDDSKAGPKAEGAAATPGDMMVGQGPDGAAIGTAMAGFEDLCKKAAGVVGQSNESQTKKTQAQAIMTEVAKLISARDALVGTVTTSKCGELPKQKVADKEYPAFAGEPVEAIRKTKSAAEFRKEALDKVTSAGAESVGTAGKLGAAASKDDGEVDDKDITAARAAHKGAVEMVAAGKKKVETFKEGDSPFTESELGILADGPGGGQAIALGRQALKAKTALREYPAKEEKVLKDLDGLIGGLEAAGSKKGADGKDATPTVPDAIAVNKSLKDANVRIKALTLTEVAIPDSAAGTPKAAADPYVPADDAKVVREKITDAQGKVGKAGEGAAAGSGLIAAIKKAEDKKAAAEKATPPATFTIDPADKAEIEKAGAEAATAIAAMRKQQMDVMTSVGNGLADLKAGKRSAGAPK